MAKYKPQHSRLLFIDKQLRENRFPNCSTLAEAWEVSISTIQRDLDYMRCELNAPIEYSPKQRGYYYTEEQYRLPAMDIRESDLFAIYLADKLLGQYEGTPIYESLRSVFSKIENSLPDKIATRPGNDQGLFTVLPPFATVIVPEVLATVFDCLRTSTRLETLYRVGHCHLRGALRTFSLARMLAARKGKERFTIPASFDFRTLFGSHFGIHWGEGDIEVRIRFARQAAAYVRERRWHPSQTLQDEPDGSLLLTLTVNHLLELKRWILSWGDVAQVLTPPELAADLRATAQRMAAL